jgi:hypothetical protein
MESILGGLAFAGIIVAQFLAVVALHDGKWNGDTSFRSDLFDKAIV